MKTKITGKVTIVGKILKGIGLVAGIVVGFGVFTFILPALFHH